MLRIASCRGGWEMQTAAKAPVCVSAAICRAGSSEVRSGRGRGVAVATQRWYIANSAGHGPVPVRLVA